MSTKKSVFLCFSSLVLFAIALLLFRSAESHKIPSSSYQSHLESEREFLGQKLNELQSFNEKSKLFDSISYFEELYDQEDLSIFILKDKATYFWNEAESPITISSLAGQSEFLKTNSSLHFIVRDSIDGFTYIIGRQIVRRYPYRNSYLQAEVSKNWQPYLNELPQLNDWKLNQLDNSPNALSWLGILLLFIAIFSILTALPHLLTSNENHVWIIRFLMLLLSFIAFKLFNLEWYRSADFNYAMMARSSLDLLITSIHLLLGSYFIINIGKKVQSFWLKCLYFLAYILLIALSFDLIHSAVLNTQINLELDNIFKLDHSGLLILLSFGFLFLTALLYLNESLNGDSWPNKRLQPLIYGFGFLITFLISNEKVLIVTLLLSVLLFLILYVKRFFKGLPDLIYILAFLALCSVSTAFTIEKALKQKENSARRVLLQKLAEERDPLLEYLFVNLQEDIRTDKTLIQELDSRWDEREIYKKYLQETYFTGYWDRYRINITLCAANDSILVGPNNANRDCFEYFYDRIYREGDQISSINLFQLSNLAGRIDYIGELKLDVEEDYRLYLELSRDYFSEDLGYPELFLNEEDKKLRLKLDEYSYAVYYQGKLISSEGDYVYTTSIDSAKNPAIFYSYTTNGYDHTVLQKNENINIILTKKQTSIFSYLSRVTYLLVIFGFLLLVISLLFSSSPFHFPLLLTDFSTKIRMLITGALLMALVFFILGTSYYIKEQYELKNSRAIEDKLRSISLELDQKLGNYDSLDLEANPYVTSVLIKFSNVFYTDINLYNSDGELYASSRPEIYTQELKSQRMNPNAYTTLEKKNSSKQVQEENIGELKYLSAYVPFKNRQNQLLAYLNLPYFARQEELEEEISAFLAPTINSYVIIFTLALLISFLLINQISKPLLLIRRHISSLKLGGATELIDWQSDDEIGELVNEYNRIAIELGQSAAELAKSERETAWREMAKQIAHEIKNPLTPMKLSIQHLQHASQDPNIDLSEKIKKTSETLISQIDSLTNIAEAFSSFAKFPEKGFVEFELLPIIDELSHLYNSQASITINSKLAKQESKIKADRDIILRIFNNLFKNAIQANDKEGQARIEVLISISDLNQIEVEIKDQGKGISEQQLDHIFDPSFTTKSSGTGLGLAIVKRSMEQIGGEVKVRSTLDKETSFFLYFPKA